MKAKKPNSKEVLFKLGLTSKQVKFILHPALHAEHLTDCRWLYPGELKLKWNVISRDAKVDELEWTVHETGSSAAQLWFRKYKGEYPILVHLYPDPTDQYNLELEILKSIIGRY